ncbi:HNH endonuclease signature motif containing protein [Streptomyces sp. WI04-05B]|uniref:HNH endonuclease signature motif containing protein n=1 Tax=Streptomyces TaxID=1883 RepID=UPI0029A07004|nr:MULTISPECIES: HNH endonuclease signature motif containing protein [unclassified Streptomyces]MDX2543724.1 HNH endonuclease signature motif containing protein [Streptomyces sp. WI04-05B]MDX2582186.1 HNH endonuclease signature motif containing protein [Streptomyces sp. WI04-05A]MDX3747588.1 HNH endonuclease signature motif containing protein [Streptomyces sp. AK08-02]
MSSPKFTGDLLARTAAVSTSLADLMRRLNAPMGSGPRNYLLKRLKHYAIDTSHFIDEPMPERERRSYSKEILQEAAAQSSSIREMLKYMGFDPRDSPYGHIRKKLDHLGIDTSHFNSGRRYGPGIVRRDQLAAAVAASRSLAGVLKLLGIVDNGAGRARVKRSVEAHNLSISHFVGQAHGRGVPSKNRKSAAQILVRLEPGCSRTQTVHLRRALDDRDVPRTCDTCHVGDVWQGRRLVLEIDHINGDWLDNRQENLRYLCPSCHSQTKTFANRSHRLPSPRRTVE